MRKIGWRSIILGAAVILLLALPVVSSATEEDSASSKESSSDTCTVTFMDGMDVLYVKEVMKGSTLDGKALNAPDGYETLGWYLDSALVTPYGFGEVTDDTMVYLRKRLSQPNYSISSLSFVYDRTVHYLGLDRLEHPLIDESVVYLEWFKDGVLVGAGELLPVVCVNDSGEYSCRITLTHGKDSVTLMTPSVTVEVVKKKISPPLISPLTYNGSPQLPRIPSSPLYTIVAAEATDAGKYPVAFTLTDADNYAWESSPENTVTEHFEITKAQNSFLTEFSVFDVYRLAEDTFFADARFGKVEVIYRKKGSLLPVDGYPTEAGEYTAEAIVKGTENYEGLTSGRLDFTLLRERVLGLKILTPPKKSEYIAFEEFLPDGISALVSYSSGRTDTVGPDKLSYFYQTGDVLHANDTSVFITLDGCVAALDVKVSPAQYDLSDVVFPDIVAEYNGRKYEAIVPELPSGLDGIQLKGVIEGGASDAGEYTLMLVFKTSSPNYQTPPPLYARLTVLPKKTELEWSDTVFTYTGGYCAPGASYIDINGRKNEAEISGGAYNAGDDHTAYAKAPSNYEFTNPACPFVILKADYDVSGAYWSSDSFVYDGAMHTVTLHGLPSGIKVTGYANNTASNVGEYIAAAGISYDDANYNHPDLPRLSWSITPASYPLDGFDFSCGEFIYDGSEHYPILIGEMPIGKDGIKLSYHFSRGVCHVDEGECSVTVTFTTESSNYVAPPPRAYTVKVLPLKTVVTWDGLTFTYDGEWHIPSATSDICEVITDGAAKDAGEYLAKAVSVSSDFEILNPTVSFTVLKAENAFIEGPFIEDFFEGHSINAMASCVYGEAIFEFFLDPECKEPTVPDLAGIYYARAFVPESENYKVLISEAIRFEVLDVFPVFLSAEFTGEKLSAFDVLKGEDLKVVLHYNDGFSKRLLENEYIVKYRNGDSLRYGDTEIEIACDTHSVSLEIAVSRATYDLTGVRWIGLTQTYDGTFRLPGVEGLPMGVSVVEIVGGGLDAGEYPVSVKLSYDGENYEEPHLPEAVLVIERAVLPIPRVEGLVYSGKSIELPKSELFTLLSCEDLISAGTYDVKAELSDPSNYVFEDGSREALLKVSVEPKEIVVRVGDVLLYRFEEYYVPEIEIVGEIFPGDELGLSIVRNGDALSVAATNSNYVLSVEEGRIVRLSALSPDLKHVITVVMLLLALLILLIIALVLQHRRIAERVSTAITKRRLQKKLEEYRRAPLTEGESEAARALTGFLLPMDEERADSLISNAMAKELIEQRGDVVSTDGWRKSIINVDTLSESFSEGDTIDVNILKNKSLIPYDTAYIKVLARGAVDKPLYVYANSFSHTAVKMLALTGGKAVKVTTQRKKSEAQTGSEKEKY